MKQNIQTFIDAMIKQDTNAAAAALKKYIVSKSSSIINENADENQPIVDYKCSNDSCVIRVKFPLGTSSDRMENVAASKYLTQVEQSVGGVANDKVRENVWLVQFTNVTNPTEFVNMYKDAISNAWEQTQEVETEDDFNDSDSDDYGYDEDKAASAAEDQWLKGRGY